MAATAFSQVVANTTVNTKRSCAELRGKGRQEPQEPESTCKPLIAPKSPGSALDL